ncbi:FtsX-like permease family protein [Bacteroidales bacterium OttesenSCG-928-B11]|nr:FtsX-like permease family protein [Bacteroidales bacterium OttesenSCG-928-E04]MDL2307967.1 FtsX-like permease family protein [Bacteroidales bacterium OttesenSCG-928-C03]MDL2311672.1 FtsX-like permease family protein [Bacteroidales bacterium OttesenSCG-928-B11]MDL2325757.1 FtsX-like permease family protein [Bacteroidales bacterium OttesenSCG-928-A14]
MLKQTLKIVWKERKTNLWILLELFIPFVILNCCLLFVYSFTKMYVEDPGHDIEHTYQIILDYEEEARNEEKREENNKKLFYMLELIKQHPAVESAALSIASAPNMTSYRGNGIYIDGEWAGIWQKDITPQFFDVFKIDFLKGRSFDENSLDHNVIISGMPGNSFFGNDILNVGAVYFDKDGAAKEVVGVTAPIKRSQYDVYEFAVYCKMTMDNRALPTFHELSVRVKPEADVNFEDRFFEDMKDRLEIYPYYLSKVESYQLRKKEYAEMMEYDRDLTNISIISFFLLLNIFLGIVGTFWFRVQARRQDIGLRLSLGATSRDIRREFFSETLLLLGIAAVLALVVIVNLAVLDPFFFIDFQLSANSWINIGVNALIFLATFGILALFCLLAVWYPARQAGKMQPHQLAMEN